MRKLFLALAGFALLLAAHTLFAAIFAVGGGCKNNSSNNTSVTATCNSSAGVASDLLVAVVSAFGHLPLSSEISDSVGSCNSPCSTWTLSTTYADAGNGYYIGIYWTHPAATGASHSIVYNSGVSNSFPGICVQPFANSNSGNPFDANSAGATYLNSTTAQSGSLTPAANNELMVVGTMFSSASEGTVTINNGFTQQLHQVGSGTGVGCALSYKVKTDALAENPTLTMSFSNSGANIQAAYTQIPGGGNPPPATFTALSCSYADVVAVVNGAIHVAVDGDTIIIPTATCPSPAAWTTTVTIPTGAGITITGNSGIPNFGGSTSTPSAGCASGTVITLNGPIAFTASPQYGNHLTRISCLNFKPAGSGLGAIADVLGTCTFQGCPNFREDNLTISGFANHQVGGGATAYGINVVEDVFGVLDHNALNGTGSFPPAGTGSAAGLSQDSTTGSGTGATFNVGWSGGRYCNAALSSCNIVDIAGGGTGYAVHDNIVINGNHAGIGGASPANDLTISVLAVSSGAITAVAVSGYLVLAEINHGSFPFGSPTGDNLWGDNSWAQPENYGSANFVFIENNTFNTSSPTEDEAFPRGLSHGGGGRVVVRFNQFTNMNFYTYMSGWHGTETGSRTRSIRAAEIYANVGTCSAADCSALHGWRGSTGLIWGNTDTLTTGVGAAAGYINFQEFRAAGNAGLVFHACDGLGPYDTNEGVNYYSGVIASGGGTTTVSVAGNPWTAHQFSQASNNGFPYSVDDSSITNTDGSTGNGSEIIDNTTNSITFLGGFPGSPVMSNGDSITIQRATACIDQPSGRGKGLLYTGTDFGTPPTGHATPIQSSAQVVSPAYIWMTSFPQNQPTFATRGSIFNGGSVRIIESRDWYTEDIGQAIQANNTTPFDGTNTKGIGHGTRVSPNNRPTTCTINTAYFATDAAAGWNDGSNSNYTGNGVLDVCTSTNTWTNAFYKPYNYPHPLTISGPPGGYSGRLRVHREEE